MNEVFQIDFKMRVNVVLDVIGRKVADAYRFKIDTYISWIVTVLYWEIKWRQTRSEKFSNKGHSDN